MNHAISPRPVGAHTGMEPPTEVSQPEAGTSKHSGGSISPGLSATEVSRTQGMRVSQSCMNEIHDYYGAGARMWNESSTESHEVPHLSPSFTGSHTHALHQQVSTAMAALFDVVSGASSRISESAKAFQAMAFGADEQSAQRFHGLGRNL